MTKKLTSPPSPSQICQTPYHSCQILFLEVPEIPKFHASKFRHFTHTSSHQSENFFLRIKKIECNFATSFCKISWIYPVESSILLNLNSPKMGFRTGRLSTCGLHQTHGQVNIAVESQFTKDGILNRKIEHI